MLANVWIGFTGICLGLVAREAPQVAATTGPVPLDTDQGHVVRSSGLEPWRETFSYRTGDAPATTIYLQASSRDARIALEARTESGAHSGDVVQGEDSCALVVELPPLTDVEFVLRVGPRSTPDMITIRVLETSDTLETLELRRLASELANSPPPGTEAEMQASARSLEELAERIDTASRAGLTGALEDALETVASLAAESFDLELAELLLKRLYGFRERAYPPDHPERLQVASSLGTVLVRRDRDSEALAFLEQPVSFYGAASGLDDTVRLANALNVLAGAYAGLHQYERSRELSEEAIERLRPFANDRPRTFLNLKGSLALTLSELGDTAEALDLQIEVLTGYADLGLPETDDWVQAARMNLATTLLELGDHERARLLREEVLEQVQRVHLPDAPEVLIQRFNVAQMMRLEGDYAQAEAELRAIIDTLAADPQYPTDVPRSELVLTLQESGRAQLALVEAKSLVDELSAASGPHDPRVLYLKNRLAELHWELGNSVEAAALAEAVLAAYESSVASDAAPGKELQIARINAAWCRLVGNNVRGASQLIASVVQSARRSFDALLYELAPRQLESLAFDSADAVSQLLSLTADPRVAEDEGLQVGLFGLVESLRSVAARAARFRRLLAEASGDGRHLDEAHERVRAANAAVSQALSRDLGEAELRERLLARDQARLRFRDLADRFSPDRADWSPDASLVAERLASKEVALTFWRYTRVSLGEGADSPGTIEPSYVAFIVRPTGGLVRVELGPCAPVDDLLRLWNGLVRGRKDEEAARVGHELRKKLLAPLKEYLGDATRIRVCPDSALHYLAFESLPTPDGGFVGDRRTFVYGTSVATSESAAPRPVAPLTLLAIGGVDYGASEGQGYPSHPLRRGMYSTREPYRPLPATGPEIQDVSDTVQGALGHNSQRMVLLREGDVLQEWILELAPKARFLHFATHADLGADIFPEVSTFLPRSPRDLARVFSPMSLTTLTLSNANEAGSAEEWFERHLSSEELASLDLHRCELAVLSACGTSRGLHRSGQGMASLQSGLHAAGVGSTLTSLWSVPDRSSADLISEFYRLFLAEGHSKGEALWRAKMHLHGRRDAEGRPIYSQADWAGWVLHDS